MSTYHILLKYLLAQKSSKHTFCVSKRRSRKLPFSMKGKTTRQSRLSIETPIIFRTFGWSRPLVIVASRRKSSISPKLISSSEMQALSIFGLNSLWFNVVIWHHRSWSTLAIVMAFLSDSTNPFLEKCCRIINEIPRHSFQAKIYLKSLDTYHQVMFEIHTFQNHPHLSWERWVNFLNKRLFVKMEVNVVVNFNRFQIFANQWPIWLDPSQVWALITYLLSNFNGCTVKVREWISSFWWM